MARTLTACEHLRRWCKPRGRTAELARILGTARSTIYRWLAGDTIPDPAARFGVEQVTGIPRGSWTAARAEKRAA